jgi:hypothetical protein
LDDAKIEHQEKGFYELYNDNTQKFLNYNTKDVKLTNGINEAANVLGFKTALRNTIGLDYEDTSDNKDFITMMVRRKLHENKLVGPTAVEPDDPGQDAHETDDTDPSVYFEDTREYANCENPAVGIERGERLQTVEGGYIRTDDGDAYCDECHTITDGDSVHHLALQPNPEKQAETGGSLLGTAAKAIGGGLVIIGGLAVAAANGTDDGGDFKGMADVGIAPPGYPGGE